MLSTLCLTSLLLIVNADTSVHILSSKFKNPITSSTLNWVPESHYTSSKDFVIGAFENIESSDGSPEDTHRLVFVCRALHDGIWVAGSRKESCNKCAVSLAGSVHSYDRYQLLENIESAARVSWTNWTKYYQPPIGAVSTADKKLFVARLAVRSSDQIDIGMTHRIGTLDAQDSLGTITYVHDDGTEASTDHGQVLVETEPIAYELTSLRLNEARSRFVRKSPRVLTEVLLTNSGNTLAGIAEALTYSYEYSLYWGQGHAMLKGLNTSVTLQNRTRLPDLKWGIEVRENRTDVYSLELRLDPGTAVNVSLRGVHAVLETPYSARLFSHYEDGASLTPRQITGERREEGIFDIVLDIGPVFFLGNGSLTPLKTQAPPMNTEPPTTLRQTAAPAQKIKKIEPGHKAHLIDENAIKRPDGMQADDGSPLSLKDKDGRSKVAASARPELTSQSLLALVAVHIFTRVT